VKLTPNFSLDELACHDDTPVPAEWVESRAVPLSATAPAQRDNKGPPRWVMDRDRTPGGDDRGGGAHGSQHLQAKAHHQRAGTRTAGQEKAAGGEK
jgi:hypothetical protein